MSEAFYLTTPLYYVNDAPHLGHAYTTILADVLARYRRLFYGPGGVHFLTGLDEHGQKVAEAAARAGLDPQTHCDRMNEVWRAAWRKLHIHYDDFIRTTEPRHQQVVLELLRRLWNQGDIYSRDYVGWYSVYEERFFTEKDLVDGRDPIGGRPVEKLAETNYFFRMSKYQGWLIDHYRSHPQAVLPPFRMNEVMGFLANNQLDDLCISRPKSRLSWGIPLPWDQNYVTYVWFDALVNYYSATVHPPAGCRVSWPADYHLIGKDILTTHAVYWPIMLHACGLEPPRHILAHGWWLDKSLAKMSKSAGNVVKPLELADQYGADAFRYVLMREMVVGQDAGFSPEAFIARYNSDLANDLGNLYGRLAKLWNSRRADASPTENAEIDPVRDRAALGEAVKSAVDELRIHSALETLADYVRRLNQFVERRKLWANPAPGAISAALEGLYTVAELLEPVMPAKMSELKVRLKPDGVNLHPQVAPPLFPRIAVPANQTPPAAPAATVSETRIALDDFAKVDLRLGKIVRAAPHPRADKLLVLTVDLGGQERTVVAGIAPHYRPDQLVGKSVVVAANLKPADLRGVVSDGMILAAASGGSLSLVTVDRDLPPGAKVS